MGSQGYQQDSDSGLMLLGHRYYDSSTGRFLTRDPVGDGRNWYAYCYSRPASSADLDGLEAATAGTIWRIVILIDELDPEPTTKALIAAGMVTVVIVTAVLAYKEHTKKKSKSKEGRHQRGQDRLKKVNEKKKAKPGWRWDK